MPSYQKDEIIDVSNGVARSYFQEIGVKGSRVGDVRTYYYIPLKHGCGKQVDWMVLIRSKPRQVRNLGAFCHGCKREIVPSEHLKVLRTRGTVWKIEQEAKKVGRLLAGNTSWFEELVAH